MDEVDFDLYEVEDEPGLLMDDDGELYEYCDDNDPEVCAYVEVEGEDEE